MTDEPDKATANELSVEMLSQLLIVSERQVHQLSKDGWFSASKRGRYPLIGSVQGYIRYLLHRLDEQSKRSADTRLRDARAREIDLRSAERDRRVIDLAEATETVDAIVGICLESFEGLPARITRNPRERTRITTIIDAERQRVADRFAEIARAVATGDRSGDGAHGDDV